MITKITCQLILFVNILELFCVVLQEHYTKVRHSMLLILINKSKNKTCFTTAYETNYNILCLFST